MNRIIFLITLALLFIPVNAQEKNPDNLLIVIGDSLIGYTIDGDKVREFVSNVVIKHGNVNITCDRALQNITRNEVDLVGNVIITQDTITIKTERGKYYGNTKVASSEAGVDLDDGHMKLKAGKGTYYSESKQAYFIGHVTLIDSISTIITDKLTYFNDEDKAIAVGNVVVKDTGTTSLLADSLVHFRTKDLLNAFGRIEVKDSKNNTTIFGEQLMSDGEAKYRKITGNPLFMQIDTTDSGKIDTLMITSMIMEQTADSVDNFIAKDSVKIMRGEFSSANNYSILYRDENKIFTYKKENEEKQPVLWYENSQLSGDSIFIYLDENKLRSIDIRENTLLVSTIENYDFRFDQISGDKLVMFFEDEDLKKVDILGNVLSIYYYQNEESTEGLIKSSAETAALLFEENSIVDVRLYGSPVSEYHPENVIEGKEQDFTIPTFMLRNEKPLKAFFLQRLPKQIYYKRGIN